MTDLAEKQSFDGTASPVSRKLVWIGVIIALVYPSLITWGYFVLAGRYSSGLQQTVYLIVKIAQFVFPAAWAYWVLREKLGPPRLTSRGLLVGMLFGAAVVGAGWLLFDELLRHRAELAAATPLIRAKVLGFGINSVWKYALLAGFYSLAHSLLEEYYWRWFVFRQLRGVVRMWPAVIVSALGFMAHHVIVLNEFFGQAPVLTVLLSAAVAIGGVFWAWLYERSGSILGPWLSHLIVDAGIFWIGFDLVRSSIST